ncbi:hypothetical protein P7K49_031041 [Saguinus oedipus]|uniref:Uncharacterized protein n=1 Tax=Saguinus oedipus TaxID=9490 RepID=A0ABQ9U3W1_SAGOE|nr:hypothetical protein P7K49_031041 [Saguinus oedipus]
MRHGLPKSHTCCQGDGGQDRVQLAGRRQKLGLGLREAAKEEMKSDMELGMAILVVAGSLFDAEEAAVIMMKPLPTGTISLVRTEEAERRDEGQTRVKYKEKKTFATQRVGGDGNLDKRTGHRKGITGGLYMMWLPKTQGPPTLQVCNEEGRNGDLNTMSSIPSLITL